jgi:hypothetical protein
MADYKHREYAIGFTMREPETDEEFKKLLLAARIPSTEVTISEKIAKRFAHLLPEGFTEVVKNSYGPRG